MKPLSRRTVIAGSAAAMTALPVLGLATGAKAATGDDTQLLQAISRYKTEIDLWNSGGGERDEDGNILDEAMDRVTEELADALCELPAVTAAGALAAIDLLIFEDMLAVRGGSDYAQAMGSLVEAVRGYLAEQAGRVA